MKRACVREKAGECFGVGFSYYLRRVFRLVMGLVFRGHGLKRVVKNRKYLSAKSGGGNGGVTRRIVFIDNLKKKTPTHVCFTYVQYNVFGVRNMCCLRNVAYLLDNGFTAESEYFFKYSKPFSFHRLIPLDSILRLGFRFKIFSNILHRFALYKKQRRRNR